VVRDRWTGAGHEELARSVIAEAGGCPALLVALAEAAGQHRVSPDGPLPDQVHEAVRAAVDDLPAAVGSVLRVAALLGPGCRFGELVDQVASGSLADEVDVARAVHAAKRARIVTVDGPQITFAVTLVWRSLAEAGGVRPLDWQHQRSPRPADRSAAGSAVSWQGEAGTASGPVAVPRPAPCHRTASERDRAVVDGLGLSGAQRAVADRVSQGMTNTQIASRLDVSPHTVDAHLRRIFKKLEINSRVELTRLVLSSEPGGVARDHAAWRAWRPGA
jgi:DNA-binding CsgD family transcriptional regulator